jgi:hypothetical protein
MFVLRCSSLHDSFYRLPRNEYSGVHGFQSYRNLDTPQQDISTDNTLPNSPAAVAESDGYTNYLNMWNEVMPHAGHFNSHYWNHAPMFSHIRSHTPEPPTISSSITTTWSCPQCTFDNKLDAGRCAICSTKKPVLPSSSRADDGWAERFGSFKVNVEMQVASAKAGGGAGGYSNPRSTLFNSSA